jgi:hypothetical protein
LDLVAGCRRLRLKVQYRNSGDDRKNTAVTAQDAVDDLVAIALEKERRHELQAPAAVRTAKKIERLSQHG